MTTDGLRICRRVCRQRADEMLVMLVLLERDNFCVNSVISLTSYAVVCSNVVVHLWEDHNELWSSHKWTTTTKRATARLFLLHENVSSNYHTNLGSFDHSLEYTPKKVNSGVVFDVADGTTDVPVEFQANLEMYDDEHQLMRSENKVCIECSLI